MSEALLKASKCCTDDSCTSPAQIPGPAGSNGSNGAAGSNGANAFTDTTASFVQPAIGSNVTVPVVDSRGMGVGQDIYVEQGGYYQLVTKPDQTHIQIKNLGYTANASPTTTVPSGVHVSPSGPKGVDGAMSGGDMLGSNNLSDVDDSTLSLQHLGGTTVGIAILRLTNPSAITFLRLNADNTVTALSAANYRTALALVPGTNVQAFNAFLKSIAGLGTAADKIIYTTGVDTAAETAITAFARTLIAAADAAAARSTLGKVLPRYGLLASKIGMDVNSAATDNAITVEASRYRIDKVVFDQASISLTTATAGLFSAAGGGGTTIAADQALAALTATTKFHDMTLSGGIGTDVLTAGTLYARCGTAQGAPATVNAFIFGWRLD